MCGLPTIDLLIYTQLSSCKVFFLPTLVAKWRREDISHLKKEDDTTYIPNCKVLTFPKKGYYRIGSDLTHVEFINLILIKESGGRDNIYNCKVLTFQKNSMKSDSRLLNFFQVVRIKELGGWYNIDNCKVLTFQKKKGYYRTCYHWSILNVHINWNLMNAKCKLYHGLVDKKNENGKSKELLL